MKIEGVNNKHTVSEISTKQNEIEKDNKKVMELINVKKKKNEEKVSEDFIIKSIEETNEKLELADRKLEFSIHDKTKQIVVKVINTKNNEVVREIPSEKILDLVANMLEQSGLVVDQRA